MTNVPNRSDLPEPPTGETSPYALIVTLWAKPELAEDLNQLLLKHVASTRNEEGNVVYHLNRGRLDPTVFYYYEAYTSIDAFREHLAAPYIAEMLEELPPYLARDYEMTFLTMSSELD